MKRQAAGDRTWIWFKYPKIYFHMNELWGCCDANESNAELDVMKTDKRKAQLDEKSREFIWSLRKQENNGVFIFKKQLKQIFILYSHRYIWLFCVKVETSWTYLDSNFTVAFFATKKGSTKQQIIKKSSEIANWFFVALTFLCHHNNTKIYWDCYFLLITLPFMRPFSHRTNHKRGQ